MILLITEGRQELEHKSARDIAEELARGYENYYKLAQLEGVEPLSFLIWAEQQRHNAA
jgi:hypothetical protein